MKCSVQNSNFFSSFSSRTRLLFSDWMNEQLSSKKKTKLLCDVMNEQIQQTDGCFDPFNSDLLTICL
jgi:hypothetical protein